MGACGSKADADVDGVLGTKLDGLQTTVNDLTSNISGLQQLLKTAATTEDVQHIIKDIGALKEQQCTQTSEINDKLQVFEEQGQKILITTEACSEGVETSNKLHVESHGKADEVQKDIQLLQQTILRATEQLADLQKIHNETSTSLGEMAKSLATNLSAVQSQLNRFEDKGVKLAAGENKTLEESVEAVSQQAGQVLAELFAYQRRLDNITTTLDKVSLHASEAASFRQIDDLASDVQSLKSKLVKPPRSPAKAPPTMSGWTRQQQDALTKTHVVLDCKSAQISARASGAITLRNWSSDRTFYNKEVGGSWVFAAPSSSKASVSFCLKDIVPYDFSLVLTHLTSYDVANQRPGHAPIRVSINDTVLISDHEVGSFDYITERWAIPSGVLLPAGWENKVVLQLGPSASTSYWLQRLEVRPNAMYGQPVMQL